MDHLINLLVEYGLYLGIPLTFLVVVAWIYRPNAKKLYQADGNIPFYGDKKADKTRQGGH
jgi:cbb3-type cytochrome oxidase subunit 3